MRLFFTEQMCRMGRLREISILSVRFLHRVQEFLTRMTPKTRIKAVFICEIRVIRVRIFSGLSRLGISP